MDSDDNNADDDSSEGVIEVHTLEEIGWSPPRSPPLDDADSIGSDYAGVMTDEQYNAALGVRFAD